MQAAMDCPAQGRPHRRSQGLRSDHPDETEPRCHVIWEQPARRPTDAALLPGRYSPIERQPSWGRSARLLGASAIRSRHRRYRDRGARHSPDRRGGPAPPPPRGRPSSWRNRPFRRRGAADVRQAARCDRANDGSAVRRFCDHCDIRRPQDRLDGRSQQMAATPPSSQRT